MERKSLNRIIKSQLTIQDCQKPPKPTSDEQHSETRNVVREGFEEAEEQAANRHQILEDNIENVVAEQQALGLQVSAEHVTTREHIAAEVARQLEPLKRDAEETRLRAQGEVPERRPDQTASQRKYELDKALAQVPALRKERQKMAAIAREDAKTMRQEAKAATPRQKDAQHQIINAKRRRTTASASQSESTDASATTSEQQMATKSVISEQTDEEMAAVAVDAPPPLPANADQFAEDLAAPSAAPHADTGDDATESAAAAPPHPPSGSCELAAQPQTTQLKPGDTVWILAGDRAGQKELVMDVFDGKYELGCGQVYDACDIEFAH